MTPEEIALEHGIKRSSHWPAVEKAHLHKQPKCLVCGSIHPLNVHHKFPFHYVIALGRPDLELDERNLFTLCTDPVEQHHILLGHLDDYQSYNPDLEHFMALCRGLLGSQIRAMPEYHAALKIRPARLGDMTNDEKKSLREKLDTLMPRIIG